MKTLNDKLLDAIFSESETKEERLQRKVIAVHSAIISVLEKLAEMFNGEIIENPSEEDVARLLSYNWKPPVIGKVQLEDGTLVGISKYFDFDNVSYDSLVEKHLVSYQNYNWVLVSVFFVE